MKAADVSTRQYKFSHGITPRGYAPSWAFVIRWRDGGEYIYWAQPGTYSEARRGAVAYANQTGATSVEVAP